MIRRNCSHVLTSKFFQSPDECDNASNNILFEDCLRHITRRDINNKKRSQYQIPEERYFFDSGGYFACWSSSRSKNSVWTSSMIIQIMYLSNKSFSSWQVKSWRFTLKQKSKKFLLNSKNKFFSKKFCHIHSWNGKALKWKYTT